MSETIATHCPDCGASTRRETDADGWEEEVCTNDDCARIVVAVVSRPGKDWYERQR